MIILDTETTGLIQERCYDLNKQPEILELAALKIDDDFKISETLRLFFRPTRPIPPAATAINHITDQMCLNKRPFVFHLDEIRDFFLGECHVTGANVAYDIGMLKLELKRIGKDYQFPWSWYFTDVIEDTKYFNGHRLKLSEIYERLFGFVPNSCHSALTDCYMCYQILKKTLVKS